MSVFIIWEETENKFSYWQMGMPGSGELLPTFTSEIVERRALWSHDESPESVQAAQKYIAANRPEAAVRICEWDETT